MVAKIFFQITLGASLLIVKCETAAKTPSLFNCHPTETVAEKQCDFVRTLDVLIVLDNSYRSNENEPTTYKEHYRKFLTSFFNYTAFKERQSSVRFCVVRLFKGGGDMSFNWKPYSLKALNESVQPPYGREKPDTTKDASEFNMFFDKYRKELKNLRTEVQTIVLVLTRGLPYGTATNMGSMKDALIEMKESPDTNVIDFVVVYDSDADADYAILEVVYDGARMYDMVPTKLKTTNLYDTGQLARRHASCMCKNFIRRCQYRVENGSCFWGHGECKQDGTFVKVEGNAFNCTSAMMPNYCDDTDCNDDCDKKGWSEWGACEAECGKNGTTTRVHLNYTASKSEYTGDCKEKETAPCRTSCSTSRQTDSDEDTLA